MILLIMDCNSLLDSLSPPWTVSLGGGTIRMADQQESEYRLTGTAWHSCCGNQGSMARFETRVYVPIGTSLNLLFLL